MTREGKRGLLGAALALGGQLGNLAVLAAAAIVLPRLLGPADFGLFSAAMAVVAVLFVVSTLGLGLGEARFLSPLAAGDDFRAVGELASSFWVVRLLASAAAALACGLWIRLSTDLALATALTIGLFAVARYAFQATRSLLLPLDRIRSYVGLEVLQSIAFLGFFVVGYIRGGLESGFVAVGAANLALFLLALQLVRKRARLSVGRFRLSRLRPLLGYNAYAFVGSLANTVRTFLPVWAVAVWSGARQAAFFGLAAQVLAWTTMLFAAVLQALLPVLSELETRGESDRARGWLDLLMRLAAASLCAVAVVWALVGRDLLDVVLGPDYGPAFAPVAILLVTSMVSAVGVAANALHFLRRRARTGALNLMLACAITLAGLGWALTGAAGSAANRTSLVYLVSALVFLAATVGSVYRAEGDWPAMKRVLWLMLPAALAWAAMDWQAPLPQRLAAAGGFVVVYVGTVLGGRLIAGSELRYLAEILGPRSGQRTSRTGP